MSIIETFLNSMTIIIVGSVAIAGVYFGRKQHQFRKHFHQFQNRRNILENRLRELTERKPSYHIFTGETEQIIEGIVGVRDQLLSEATISIRNFIREYQFLIRSFRFSTCTLKSQLIEETIARLEGETNDLYVQVEELYNKLLINEEFIRQIHLLLHKAESEYVGLQRNYGISFPYLYEQIGFAVQMFKDASVSINEQDPLKAHERLIKADELVSLILEYVAIIPTLLTEIQEELPDRIQLGKLSTISMHDEGFEMIEKPPELCLAEMEQIYQSLLPNWREGRIHEVLLGKEQLIVLEKEIEHLFSEQRRLKQELPQMLEQLPIQLAALHHNDDHVTLQLDQLKRDYVVQQDDDLFFYFQDLEEMDRAVEKLFHEAKQYFTHTEQHYILAEEKLLRADYYIEILQERKKEIQDRLSSFVTTEEQIRSSMKLQEKEMDKIKIRINQSVIQGVPPEIQSIINGIESSMTDIQRLSEVRPMNTVQLPELLKEVSLLYKDLEKAVGQVIYAADLAYQEMELASKFRTRNERISSIYADAEAAFRTYMFKEAYELALEVCREGQRDQQSELETTETIQTLSRSRSKKYRDEEKRYQKV